MTWRQISSQQDFPNVEVWQADGEKGKKFQIIFDNLEYATGRYAMWADLGVLAAIMSFFPAVLLPIPFTKSNWFFVWLPAVIFYFIYMKQPWTIRRTIELDLGTGALRVLRNGRPELKRNLSVDTKFTVEPHPEAEHSRMRRQEKGQKALTKEERTHCLFGFFGGLGAEKLILVSRVEDSPGIRSLYEVHQAIFWALRESIGTGSQAAGTNETDKPRQGMNPPLD